MRLCQLDGRYLIELSPSEYAELLEAAKAGYNESYGAPYSLADTIDEWYTALIQAQREQPERGP